MAEDKWFEEGQSGSRGSMTCVACGKKNPAGALLCNHCGAPMPEEGAVEVAPAPSEPPGLRAKRRKKILLLSAIGLLVVGGAVTAWLLLRGPSVSAMELSRKMPKGMQYVGGLDLYSLVRTEKIKGILDNGLVKPQLEKVKNEYGVDVHGLESMAGGISVEDGKLHLLFVVMGGLDRDKLEGLISKQLEGTVMIDGNTFRAIPYSGKIMGLASRMNALDEDLDAEQGVDAKEEKKSETEKPPEAEDWVVGFIDSDTLVVGTPLMVQRYLEPSGTVEDDSDMNALLEKVEDAKAHAWSVGHIDKAAMTALPMVVPFFKGIEFEEGATFAWWARLDENLSMVLEVDVKNEEAAKKLESVVDLDKLPTEVKMMMTMLGGRDTLKVERSGTTLRASITLPIPNFPGF